MASFLQLPIVNPEIGAVLTMCPPRLIGTDPLDVQQVAPDPHSHRLRRDGLAGHHPVRN
jgi:hypothetical protein